MKQPKPKTRKRYSIRTYAKLTLGVVILAGLNYVFTKLFDSLYGKFDPGFIIGTSILFFAFVGFFILFLWLVDTKGTLAHMMGVRDKE